MDMPSIVSLSTQTIPVLAPALLCDVSAVKSEFSITLSNCIVQFLNTLRIDAYVNSTRILVFFLLYIVNKFHNIVTQNKQRISVSTMT